MRNGFGRSSLVSCGFEVGARARTYFLYDGALPVIEMDGSGNFTGTNTFGANGLVSRHTGAGSTFYSFDHQGNVCQRLNSSGGVLTSHMFDAYGTGASTGQNPDPWGFGAQWGYYTDNETGLILCTFRYYDPARGRFLNRDPIGYEGGINLYGYCGNGPVAWADPMGLIHIGVSIDPKTGLGIGWITANPGDNVPGYSEPAQGGELIWIFPVSNRVGKRHAKASPWKPHAH